jgi:hypothetical protein
MSHENKLITIRPSHNINYRYEAIMEKKNMERYHIPFGNKSTKIYRDTTPLQLYKNDNTNSIAIKQKNVKRIFSKNTNIKKYTPDWFELIYLNSYLISI